MSSTPAAKSDDDLYREGSQYRIWSFSQSELEEVRRSVNRIASEHLAHEHQMARSAERGGEEEGVKIEYLTEGEEYEMLLHYCVKVQDAAAVYKLPSHIKATAIQYLKRFYLKYSLMEFHPRNIMYTCLFLATKSENHFISIDNFVQPLQRVSKQSIIDLEFIVAQTLSFTLLVHHAFNPIHGYFLDLQSVFADRMDEIRSAHDRARRYANDSLFSDAAFLFTPPQIALAALMMANEGLMDAYMDVKFGQNAVLLRQLKTTTERIKSYIVEGGKPKIGSERALALERKLYVCRNPEKARKRFGNGSSSESLNDSAEPAAKRVKIEQEDTVMT
ncbi:cyclin-like protein [Myxozyma melibiosi]|uniref:Cyclin-like protein n=1 Tax=Myxozyma melibiosi TaxID=54550 RepID=A0ABR1F3M4_9ASCO